MQGTYGAKFLKYDKLLGRVGESAAARLGDEHHILYPDSEEAGQVDAGLCGDKMSGGEKLVLLRVGRDARLLVNLHAYAVTRAVTEEFAVAFRSRSPPQL